jgi:hypothetical protein
MQGLAPHGYLRAGLRAQARGILRAVSERSFYSDRVSGAMPRTREEVTPSAWKGLVTLIRQRIDDGSLGQAFPQRGCRDDPLQITGTNHAAFYDMLEALVPSLRRQTDPWGLGPVAATKPAPLDPDKSPSTSTALDVVDFVAQRIAAPLRHSGNYHAFFDHYHLAFDPGVGQRQFQSDVDEIFARNGIAFTLGGNLQVRRLGPPEARPLLSEFTPNTGDQRLDELLRTALTRFLSRNKSDRQDALEKLWDAFERLKTLEFGGDKKASIVALINRAAPNSGLRDHLDAEATALTRIGNSFHIRHSEHGQEELPGDPAVDYLFIRLAALIALLLRQTGRMQQG